MQSNVRCQAGLQRSIVESVDRQPTVKPVLQQFPQSERVGDTSEIISWSWGLCYWHELQQDAQPMESTIHSQHRTAL